MGVLTLAHYAVYARDLDASERFYVEVLGFHSGYRPPFGFAGRWLYSGPDDADCGIVHLIGMDNPDAVARYTGAHASQPWGGAGAIDHIAFKATGLGPMRERLQRIGIACQERTTPSLGLRQVFLSDPSGVTIELNYPAAEVVGRPSGEP